MRRVIALLMPLLLFASPAAATGLPEPDPEWGVDGVARLPEGYIPRWIFVDDDGTAWVVGHETAGDLIPTFLVRIPPDGSEVHDIALDVPDSYEAYRVVRTRTGFAILFHDEDSNVVIAKLDVDGSLDDRFAVQILGLSSEVGLHALLAVGDGIVAAGSIDDPITLDVDAAITRLLPNGEVDEAFGDGGTITMRHTCAATVEVLLPTVMGFDSVSRSCDGGARDHLIVTSFERNGEFRNRVEFTPTFLDLGRLNATEMPDGRRILNRVGLYDDLDTTAHLQIITLGAASLRDRIVDHGGLLNHAAVVMPDRLGGVVVLADLGASTLVVDAVDATSEPLVTSGRPPLVATIDWATGAIYQGWEDGTVTRSAPDGSGPFTDDDSSVHELNIERLSSAGLTTGCNTIGTWFCPDEPVTRGAMAAFLNRALDLPAVAPTFGDVGQSIFAADIGALEAAGIARGCAPGRFCPDDPVTRGQIAALLNRALALDGGEDAFGDDDGSVFEADIDALAAAGITRGCALGSYCPNDAVTRAQMASLLVRAGLDS